MPRRVHPTCVTVVDQHAQSVLGGEVGEGEGVKLCVGDCTAAGDVDGGLPVAPTGGARHAWPFVRCMI